jgi:hypothetical protein
MVSAFCIFGSDERTCIAEVILDRPLTILDFQEIDRYSEGEDAQLIRMLALSSLLSSPRVQSGWRRPEYVFTRFVADCARSAGFEAIKYPTCRTVEGHKLVVLHAPDQDWKRSIRL